MSPPDLVWRKSSRSNGQADCVELAVIGDGLAVRDSKNPDGPVLVFPAGISRVPERLTRRTL